MSLDLHFYYAYAWVGIFVHECMYVLTEARRKPQNSLELELQVSMSPLKWALRTRRGSSGRPVHVLTRWDISPSSTCFYLYDCLWPLLSEIAASQHFIDVFFFFWQLQCGWKWIRKSSQSQCLPEFRWVIFWLHFVYCMCVCTSYRAYVRAEGNYESLHSPSTVWVSGIKLRLARLVASVHCATSPVLQLVFEEP